MAKAREIDLRPSERILKTASATLPVALPPPQGVLTLTNQRLIWRHGWFRWPWSPSAIEIEIADITRSSRSDPGLIVETASGQYSFIIGYWGAPLLVYLFGSKKVEEWESAIEAARESAKPAD